MCGIVGYVGPRAALGVVLEGLRRMEYRGYDSAGIAIVGDQPDAEQGGGTPPHPPPQLLYRPHNDHQHKRLYVAKKAGKSANLDAELASHPLPGDGLGIGHTRWATHGGPTDLN